MGIGCPVPAATAGGSEYVPGRTCGGTPYGGIGAPSAAPPFPSGGKGCTLYGYGGNTLPIGGGIGPLGGPAPPFPLPRPRRPLPSSLPPPFAPPLLSAAAPPSWVSSPPSPARRLSESPTFRGLPFTILVCVSATALVASSTVARMTNPRPVHLPPSLSVRTMVCSTVPWGSKIFLSSSSVISSLRFLTQRRTPALPFPAPFFFLRSSSSMALRSARVWARWTYRRYSGCSSAFSSLASAFLSSPSGPSAFSFAGVDSAFALASASALASAICASVRMSFLCSFSTAAFALLLSLKLMRLNLLPSSLVMITNDATSPNSPKTLATASSSQASGMCLT
mmetsp:Transcript_53106/g.137164  ORF Transcript_53106/g.137164 Transcript_53106/m.137164 type:complete len:337 (+) Transcript_53106:118-1128(+)